MEYDRHTAEEFEISRHARDMQMMELMKALNDARAAVGHRAPPAPPAPAPPAPPPPPAAYHHGASSVRTETAGFAGRYLPKKFLKSLLFWPIFTFITYVKECTFPTQCTI